MDDNDIIKQGSENKAEYVSYKFILTIPKQTEKPGRITAKIKFVKLPNGAANTTK